MASGQEAGQVEVWAKSKDGKQKRVLRSHVSRLAPQGGAADGALSSVLSPDELMFVPVTNPLLQRDDFLEVIFIPEAADGVDVSDCVWQIPVTKANGGVEILSRADFDDFTQADFTGVANMPMVFGRYKVTEPLRFGGSHIYCDVQDDTA
jgi:hypothetical protein|tara:strand:- start:2307 stop:2756 length:450 start_codon:yes stop_codon:yes gene_type:complete